MSAFLTAAVVFTKSSLASRSSFEKSVSDRRVEVARAIFAGASLYLRLDRWSSDWVWNSLEACRNNQEFT